MNLNDLRDQAHRIATEHGFKDASVGEDIALMHSELSEALEDFRAGHAPNEVWYELGPVRLTREEVSQFHVDGSVYEKNTGTQVKPCGIPSEAADVIIRIMHFCGKHRIDIEQAVKEKMAFNNSRPFKHGGKKL